MTLGAPITDPEEQLYRQVHPSWIQEGRVTSVAWKPTPKDRGLLSVSRAKRCTAAESFAHHTQKLQLQSAGVWAVTVQDCTKAKLAVFEDPIEAPVPDPAHAVIDFRDLSNGEIQAKAQQLKAAALLVHTSR